VIQEQRGRGLCGLLGRGEDGNPIGNPIWGWVKTLVPSEPQNSWDLWMFIPLNMVLIGIDPYPYEILKQILPSHILPLAKNSHSVMRHGCEIPYEGTVSDL